MLCIAAMQPSKGSSTTAVKRKGSNPIDTLTLDEQNELSCWIRRAGVIIVSKLVGVHFNTVMKAALGEDLHAYSVLCIRAKMKEALHGQE